MRCLGEAWRDALLALKPDFELGALRFPDLRMYLLRATAAQERQVARDILKIAREVEFSGIDFSHPQTISAQVDDKASEETIIDGEKVVDPSGNRVTFCGDSAGASRFLEIAHGAGSCIGEHLEIGRVSTGSSESAMLAGVTS